MNRRRVRALLRKEWFELRQQKTVVASMLITPVVLVGNFLPAVLMMVHTPVKPGHLGMKIPAALAHLDPRLAMIHQLNDMTVLMLMLIPATMPMIIGSFSIIGEKKIKSLEPLLASPLATGELLLAKALAAALVPLLVGWASCGVHVLGLALGAPGEVVGWVLRPASLLGMLLLTPLLALLSTLLAVAVSSRSHDPRAAQLWIMAIVLPLLGLGTALFLGLVLNLEIMAASVLTVGLACYAMYRLAIWLFRREVIITRWR